MGWKIIHFSHPRSLENEAKHRTINFCRSGRGDELLSTHNFAPPCACHTGSDVFKLENRGIDTRSPVSLSDRKPSRSTLLSCGASPHGSGVNAPSLSNHKTEIPVRQADRGSGFVGNQQEATSPKPQDSSPRPLRKPTLITPAFLRHSLRTARPRLPRPRHPGRFR
ncbi:hypothetical protein CA85_33260 [Allorhodopirellula solitaria]|uniref:Uncharacterized protein n=1 Tax=Allorhodopirellula solitaria TaxID=2527987 RepID=A0A5C5XR48_9BACT|nr:hypothetical protein CA85_33260 [Allorhodopirellula solitaria]